MAKFDLNDSGVVVIVGSGAGGGTLGMSSRRRASRSSSSKPARASRTRTSSTMNGRALPSSRVRHAHHVWELACRQGFRQSSGLDRQSGRRLDDTLGGASLRFDEHEFRTKTVYSGMPGANLLDWPITLAEMEPWYSKAENKMGVTRTNGIPGLPGNNNFKVLEAGAKKLGYKTCTPATWRSTASPATGAEPASRLVSASRAANRARNGRRSTPKFPRAKRPEISKCALTAW